MAYDPSPCKRSVLNTAFLAHLIWTAIVGQSRAIFTIMSSFPLFPMFLDKSNTIFPPVKLIPTNRIFGHLFSTRAICMKGATTFVQLYIIPTTRSSSPNDKKKLNTKPNALNTTLTQLVALQALRHPLWIFLQKECPNQVNGYFSLPMPLLCFLAWFICSLSLQALEQDMRQFLILTILCMLELQSKGGINMKHFSFVSPPSSG